jgi:hypothetical protein
VHINLQLLFNAIFLPIMTVGEPGVQGAVVTGMQGCGVNTPMAAEVAAATCGLLRVLHIPNGMIFVIGILSMVVAAGRLHALTLLAGGIVNVLGAAPKVQFIMAPLVTCIAIQTPVYFVIVNDFHGLIQIHTCAFDIHHSAGLQINISAGLYF